MRRLICELFTSKATTVQFLGLARNEMFVVEKLNYLICSQIGRTSICFGTYTNCLNRTFLQQIVCFTESQLKEIYFKTAPAPVRESEWCLPSLPNEKSNNVRYLGKCSCNWSPLQLHPGLRTSGCRRGLYKDKVTNIWINRVHVVRTSIMWLHEILANAGVELSQFGVQVDYIPPPPEQGGAAVSCTCRNTGIIITVFVLYAHRDVTFVICNCHIQYPFPNKPCFSGHELSSALNFNCRNFETLGDQNKGQYMLTAGGIALNAVSKFSHDSFEKRTSGCICYIHVCYTLCMVLLVLYLVVIKLTVYYFYYYYYLFVLLSVVSSIAWFCMDLVQ